MRLIPKFNTKRESRTIAKTIGAIAFPCVTTSWPDAPSDGRFGFYAWPFVLSETEFYLRVLRFPP